MTACCCQPSACARNGLVASPASTAADPTATVVAGTRSAVCGGQFVGVAVQPARVRRGEGSVPQVGDRDGDVVDRVTDTALVDVEQADDLVTGDDELAFVEVTVNECQRSQGCVVERALQLVAKAGEPVALRREHRCQQRHVVWAVSEAVAHRHEIVGVDGSEATDQVGERRRRGPRARVGFHEIAKCRPSEFGHDDEPSVDVVADDLRNRKSVPGEQLVATDDAGGFLRTDQLGVPGGVAVIDPQDGTFGRPVRDHCRRWTGR